jgi:hypothetical protein
MVAIGCAACHRGGAAEPANVRDDDREVVFRGACDASGAVPLSERYFIVADDEDNVLRVYDADAGGAPVAATDMSAALGLPLEGKKRPRAAELDLEAATRLGDRAYWITSHGRKKSGEQAPTRLRVFATSLPDAQTGRVQLVGRPYDRLVGDLVDARVLAPFELADAASLAPNAAGGLNIEGLTAAPDGAVWLGFRSPVPGGRALLVPLRNLPALVDGAGGGPARFGTPALLELGDGRGVRELSWWHGRYLLIGGAPANGSGSKLYTWDGPGADAEIANVDLADYNPEAIFTPEQRDSVLVLSDDGERIVDGKRCKKLDDPDRKHFRGVWVTVP